MIRLIGTDLDGTLLRRDKTLSPRNEEAVRRAASAGIQVVPVTGRPLEGLPDALEGLVSEGIIRYAITSNGAHVYDLQGDSGKPACLLRREMSAATTARVIELARAADEDYLIAEIFTEGRGYQDMKTGEHLQKRFAGTPIAAYLRKSRTVVPTLEGFMEERGGCRYENISIMLGSREARDRVAEAIETVPGILVLRSWHTDLEVIDAEADKGTAMLWLAGQLGISREETMAMGDGGNDRHLLDAAGLAVAMQNAVPELLEAADVITGAGDDDGAAEAIEKYALQ